MRSNWSIIRGTVRFQTFGRICNRRRFPWRKRCQKKLKDVSYQLSKIFCFTWTVDCQKFVQYIRMMKGRFMFLRVSVDSFFGEKEYDKLYTVLCCPSNFTVCGNKKMLMSKQCLLRADLCVCSSIKAFEKTFRAFHRHIFPQECSWGFGKMERETGELNKQDIFRRKSFQKAVQFLWRNETYNSFYFIELNWINRFSY